MRSYPSGCGQIGGCIPICPKSLWKTGRWVFHRLSQTWHNPQPFGGSLLTLPGFVPGSIRSALGCENLSVINQPVEQCRGQFLAAEDLHPLPEIEVAIVDVYDPVNNTSAKGLGEPPYIPTSAAIGCAVGNALGVPVCELPITPDKVLAVLQKKEG